MNQIFIQVRYTIGDFSDALYFTEDEYAKITEKDIETMKQERFDKYISIVPTPPTEPTKEEYDAQIEELDKERQRLDTARQEIMKVDMKVDMMKGMVP